VENFFFARSSNLPCFGERPPVRSLSSSELSFESLPDLSDAPRFQGRRAHLPVGSSAGVSVCHMWWTGVLLTHLRL